MKKKSINNVIRKLDQLGIPFDEVIQDSRYRGYTVKVVKYKLAEAIINRVYHYFSLVTPVGFVISAYRLEGPMPEFSSSESLYIISNFAGYEVFIRKL